MKSELGAFPSDMLNIIMYSLAAAWGKKQEAEYGRSEIILNTGLPPGIYLPGIHVDSKLITKKLKIK